MNLKDIVTKSEEEFDKNFPNVRLIDCPKCDLSHFGENEIKSHNRQATIALLEGVVDMVEGKIPEMDRCDCIKKDVPCCHFAQEEALTDITTPIKELIKELT